MVTDLAQCFTDCVGRHCSKAVVKCLIRERKMALCFCNVCGLRIAVVPVSAVTSIRSIAVQS